MKAPPPRSWKLAIGTHAPSSTSKALAAILGGAGLTAAGVATYPSNNGDAVSDNRSLAGTGVNNSIPAVVLQQQNSITTRPRIHQMKIGRSNRSPQILSTSPILATSDASAEKSASMAAASRLSGGKKSSISVNTGSSSNIVLSSEAEVKFEAILRVKDDNNVNNSKSNNNGIDNNSNDSNNSNNNGKSKDDNDDSYPTFTQYHHSLLKKYLTPEIWAKLSHLQTTQGTTIEDIIRAGLALPIGSNPPRRVGVLVGDAECYTVFKELLDPIISEYHGYNFIEEAWMDPELPTEQNFMKKEQGSGAGQGGTSGTVASSSAKQSVDDYGVIKSSGADDDSDENDDSSFFLDEEDDAFVEYIALPSNGATKKTTTTTQSSSSTAHRVGTIASKRKASLRRHSTIINNPRLVTNREADPQGKYIVSTRIRVARSLDGVKFPPTMSRSDRRKVQRLVDECTRHFQGANLSYGSFLPVLDMTNDQNLDLIERHILFDNPNEWTIASGLGRDWPDGRALYANVEDLQAQTPDFMIWVNEEDHLRIMCLRSGGDIQGVFTTLMNGVRELERELTKRGWHFAYDSRLGYLTSCPTNVGTSMRASVHVRLTKLGRLPGFFKLVESLKLEARGKYGETDRHYTGVFDISNAERLGKSEVHLINVMVEGVAKLIELERRLEAGETVNIDDIAG